MMNRKGFTLIELLVTIIVLSIVVGITIPVTLSVVNKAKDKELQLLIDNIASASKNMAMECNTNDTLDICSKMNSLTGISLEELAINGFLSYDRDKDNNVVIINPKSNSNVASCKINVRNDGSYSNVSCFFIPTQIIEGRT